MRTTPKSLSVVVPVYNAERHLTQQIGSLLEVLTDLTAKFEVLIVDDGSTDQTEDVALELSQRYPQVRVTRHAHQRGIEASAQTGAARTTGDIVIVHAGHEAVNASHLKRMWQHRKDEALVVAPVGSHIGGVNSDLLRQLEDWGHGVSKERHDVANQQALPNRRTAAGRSAQLPRGPKKPSIPAPMFRFSSPNDRSSMHQ